MDERTGPRTDRLAVLASRLDAWLGAAHELAGLYDLDDAAAGLRQLRERRFQPSFRIALVGAPMRGKSSLANRLLGEEVLPTGSIPTTSTPVSVLADDSSRLVVTYPDRPAETRPLTPESWADLIGIEVADAGVHTRVFVDNPWLASIAAELVDGPGVEQVVGPRATLAQQAISGSDLVVMVVSAVSPLSVTETAFLQEEVIGHHVPRILVVVTMLDRLPADERDQTFAAIATRVREISPAIQVLPAPGPDDGADSQVLADLRGTLERLTAKGNRAGLRDAHVAWRLTDHLEHMARTGEEGAHAATLDDEARSQALRQAEREAQDQELALEDIRLQLDRRRIELQRLVRQTLEDRRHKMVAAARRQLADTSNLKTWCEQELPYWLRRELAAVAGTLQAVVTERLEADLRWLDNALADQIEGRGARTGTDAARLAEVEADLPAIQVRDLARYRRFTRLGAGAGLVASAIMFNPIAAAVSLAAGWAGELLLDRLEASQREPVGRELEKAIDAALGEYERQVTDDIRAVYADTAEEVTHSATAWRADQEQAVRTSGEPSRVDWGQLARSASELRAEVLAVLEQQADGITEEAR